MRPKENIEVPLHFPSRNQGYFSCSDQLSFGDETFISHSFITSILVAVPSILKLPPPHVPCTLSYKASLCECIYEYFSFDVQTAGRPTAPFSPRVFSLVHVQLPPVRQTDFQNRVPNSTVPLYSTGYSVSVQRSKCLLDQHSQRRNDRPHI